MEEFEYTGLWWLPQDRENAIGGVLSFANQAGLRLSLAGSFRSFRDAATDGPTARKEYPLVLGVTTEGKLLTVVDCLETRFRVSFPGFESQTFSSSLALIGAHFGSEHEVRFSSAEIRYRHLPDWVRLSGFEPLYILRETGGLEKYELRYALPREATATTAGGTVHLMFTFQTGGDVLREVNLRQQVWMRTEATSELSFDEWSVDFVAPLRTFLSLATDTPNFIDDLVVYSKAKTITDGEHERQIPIRAVFSQPFYEPPGTRMIDPHNMLFTLQDVAGAFNRIIGRWFATYDQLDTAAALYSGVQYNRRVFLEQQFLSMSGAAELYHRVRVRNQALPPSEHEARKSAILTASPPEHADWLARRLRYSNEPTLRNRLTELIESSSEAIAVLVGETEAFVNTAVTTRNFLTHHDVALQEQAAAGAELYWLTQKISFILVDRFLHELGFAPEQTVELLRRNQRYVSAVIHGRKT